MPSHPENKHELFIYKIVTFIFECLKQESFSFYRFYDESIYRNIYIVKKLYFN